ncbi:MAG: pantoate--beta-alanine ligase [Deltaproteobacteria bacterium]|nr:pantoate--beta-alanine ligase [Deltaproteobacteria bacterium]
MELLRTASELHRFLAGARARGAVAFVPTMGYLHEGHVSLMREGKRRAATCVVSVFVNPTQFGPSEDLSRYPRDLVRDTAACEAAGVDALFLPEPGELYPPGAQSWVEVTEVSQGLCGERRPGHFRGVATVVAKLFALVRPDVALFGEKDWQQLQVIRALNRDLLFGIEVVGCPTVREADGLAMSSRNAYLSAEERQRALAINRGLGEAERLLAGGTRDATALCGAVREQLRAADIREDYVEVADGATLRPLSQVAAGQQARLLVAGFLGRTRLIDNAALQG